MNETCLGIAISVMLLSTGIMMLSVAYIFYKLLKPKPGCSDCKIGLKQGAFDDDIMGVYLSEPITTKDSEDGKGNKLKYGASSMQGWRVSQEDAHNCIANFDENSSLFAVYDGHGGAEVAMYLSKHLPDFLKTCTAYKNGEFVKALKECYLKIDESIITPEVIKQIQQLAKDKKSGAGSSKSTAADTGSSSATSGSSTASVSSPSAAESSKTGVKVNGSSDTTNAVKLEDQPQASQKSPSIIRFISSQNKTKSEEVASSAAPSGSKDLTKEEGKKSQQNDNKENDENVQDENKCNTNRSDAEAGTDDKTKASSDGSNSDSAAASGGSSAPETSLRKKVIPVPVIMRDSKTAERRSPRKNQSTSPGEGSDDEMEEEEEDGYDEDEEEDENERFLYGMKGPGYHSGSTAVLCFMKWETDGLSLWVANAGDSRCVVSRDGKAIDMSHDHKPELEEEARRIVKAGGKVTKDGRVNGVLNLSRAIGDHSFKQTRNLSLQEQMISPLPSVEHLVLNPSTDKFLVLACDGIWNSMSSQEVVDFVAPRLEANEPLSKICEALFDSCLAVDNTYGDGDGIKQDSIGSEFLVFYDIHKYVEQNENNCN